MASEKINFKPRDPTGWLLLSLIPFVYLYWIASSRKQINQLSGQDKGSPPIRMNHWWPVGLFIVGMAFIIGAFMVAIFGNVNGGYYSASPVPTASASTVVTYHDRVNQPSGSYRIADTDDYRSSVYNSYYDGHLEEDRVTYAELWFLGLYVLGGLILLAFSIVHFFYLLQHTEGIVRLAGSEQDKTYLIVMSAIGCFVLLPLLVAVVYKSQLVINQAISKSDQSSA